jgi:hypothetical protein
MSRLCPVSSDKRCLMSEEHIINLVDMYGYQHKKAGITKHVQTLIRPQLLNALSSGSSQALVGTHIRCSHWINGSLLVMGMNDGGVRILNRHTASTHGLDFGCVICTLPTKQTGSSSLIGSFFGGLVNSSYTGGPAQSAAVAVSGVTVHLHNLGKDPTLHTLVTSLDSHGNLFVFDGLSGELLGAASVFAAKDGTDNADIASKLRVVSGESRIVLSAGRFIK